jgi:hypothetical protein
MALPFQLACQQQPVEIVVVNHQQPRAAVIS